MSDSIKNLVKQALAMANNFIHTGRNNEAIQMLSQINKVDPGNSTAYVLMDYIVSGHDSQTDWLRHATFGLNWRGEDLSGKSIQVFCDQGMGDTINCLRYLRQMKIRWNCKIVLNCHAFYNEFKRLLECVDCIDEVEEYACYCNYHTNILSIPAILNGLQYDVYYPAHWQELLNTSIPDQPIIQGFKMKAWSEPAFHVGLAWHSNLENPIGIKKSIDIRHLAVLEDGVNEIWSLIPNGEKFNMMVQPDISDLLDTAALIMAMDVVVTVDTVSLHLAGTLNKKTLAILPYEADARWALGNTTEWYPSVELFRQPHSLDWEIPILQVKKRLESLRSLS